MKRKHIWLGLLALVAVAVLSAGATLAVLMYETDSKKNVFTASTGLSGRLQEPLFDGLDYKGEPVETGGVLGQELAQNVVPGRSIPKNPQVVNTSKTDSVWVAIRLEVKCKGLTGAQALAAVEEFADIDFQTAEAADGSYWVASADRLTYYYRSPLPAAGTDPATVPAQTAPLFTRVNIRDTDEVSTIQNFELNPTAYLLQQEGTAWEQVAGAFDTVFAAFDA